MKTRAYLMMSDIYKEKGSDASRRDVLLEARKELPAEEQLQVLERLASADIELADTTERKSTGRSHRSADADYRSGMGAHLILRIHWPSSMKSRGK